MIPLSIAVNAYDPIVRAYESQRYFLLKIRTFLFVFLLAGLWFGTERLGLLGVVTLVVFIGFVERFIMLAKVFSILKVELRDLALLKDVGKLAVAAVLAGVVAAGVRQLVINNRPIVVLAICGIAFGLVYIAAALLLEVLTVQEREALRSRVNSLQRQLFRKRAAAPLS
jgi:hypothetical protein